jgi:Cu(I)/Ag(I) efflux system protein CusF
MKQKCNLVLAIALGLGASGFATAQTALPAAASTALTSGEVRKVDMDQGKVTIRHEAIANLDMPAMTMVFRAAKPELLKGLNVGDKIQFRAETVAANFVVSDIKPAN